MVTALAAEMRRSHRAVRVRAASTLAPISLLRQICDIRSSNHWSSPIRCNGSGQEQGVLRYSNGLGNRNGSNRETEA